MTKKNKETIVRDWYPSKRVRNVYVGECHECGDVVERPAYSTSKMLARQQMQGIEQCSSRTIPVQHDDAFGSPGVLGSICQDGHQLMQDYLDAVATSTSNSDAKVS